MCLVVMPRPLPTGPLVVRRKYLIVVPRPMPAAPRRYLAVVKKLLPAALLVVRRRYLAVVPIPLPVAPLVVHRRCLIVVPRPLPAAPLAVRRRYLAVLPRPLAAAPRRCRNRRRTVVTYAAGQSTYYRLHLNSGKVTLVAMYLRRVRVAGRSFAAALAHVSAAVTPPAPVAKKLGVGLPMLCRVHAFRRDKQLGRCAAEQRKHHRLYLCSGKIAHSAMYLRRAPVVGRSFAAALTRFSVVVTPPAPAAQNLGVSLRRPCRG